jgi:hypothetical protein
VQRCLQVYCQCRVVASAGGPIYILPGIILCKSSFNAANPTLKVAPGLLDQALFLLSRLKLLFLLLLTPPLKSRAAIVPVQALIGMGPAGLGPGRRPQIIKKGGRARRPPGLKKMHSFAFVMLANMDRVEIELICYLKPAHRGFNRAKGEFFNQSQTNKPRIKPSLNFRLHRI